MKKLFAVAAALAMLTTGCAVQATRATNVTASSATLNAKVHCTSGTAGEAWWELRQSGGAWKAIGGKSAVACLAANRTLAISQTVGSLSAGTKYEFRVAAAPRKGGPAAFSNASSFATPGAARRFSPGLVSSADHSLSARAAGVAKDDAFENAAGPSGRGATATRNSYSVPALREPTACEIASVRSAAGHATVPLAPIGFHAPPD